MVFSKGTYEFLLKFSDCAFERQAGLFGGEEKSGKSGCCQLFFVNTGLHEIFCRRFRLKGRFQWE